MYQAHFGLKKPLFDNGIAQDAAVFFTPKHADIAAHIKLALTTSDSAAALIGPPGVGKTTLMSAVLRNTSTRLALGWITVAPANAAELLELLLVELGCNAHRVGRVERVQMWRQFLHESSATSTRVYVIAERADELSVEVLRALDSLTAADANGSLGANLVLLGPAALLDVLKLPALESLHQRIRLRQRLEPLTPDELRAYVDHHAKLAGGQLDKLFARDALAALHDLSGGLPRLANNLCETALTLAATRKEPLVTAELLTHVAVSLLGLEPSPARPSDARATRPTAELPSSRVAAEPPARLAVESPVVTPTPAVSQPRPIVASTPRVSTAVPGPASAAAAPAFAAAATPEPAAARLARTPQSGLATSPATTTSSAPATPSVASPAGTARTSAPARPAASLSYGPPDEDLDAFADTLTESPDVPMLDFPVLTDAVDRTRPRPDTAYAKPAAAPTPAATAKPAPRAVAPSSTQPSAQPPPRITKPAPAPAQPAHAATAAKPPPPARPSPPPAPAEDDDSLRQTMRGLMAAKSIDDISDSMAETLFGDAELDLVSAALAASALPEDEELASVPAAPPAPAPAPTSKSATPQQAAAPAEDDPFAFLGLGPDAPLELIDEPKPAPGQRKEGTRNR